MYLFWKLWIIYHIPFKPLSTEIIRIKIIRTCLSLIFKSLKQLLFHWVTEKSVTRCECSILPLLIENKLNKCFNKLLFRRRSCFVESLFIQRGDFSNSTVFCLLGASLSHSKSKVRVRWWSISQGENRCLPRINLW